MSKIKVVVCDHIHDKGLELLRNEAGIEYLNYANEDKTKLLDLIEDAEVIVTRSSTDVDEKLLSKVKKLRAVVRAGVGVDNVDIEGCTKQNIIVMNVPTANTIAAVELTMAHLINSVRSFPLANDELKNKRIWNRENWYGTELKDKKLGIIGFGNIGSRVGARAKGFEMEVIAYDPYISPSKATNMGVTYTEKFDDILACDIITIHTPKNNVTTNMIDEKEIAKMKDGVILINCARGGLYNEDALYNALASGKIRFAGIDVFTKEPATSNKLLDLANVFVTPHIGANTKESQEKIAIQAAESAILAAKGISYPNALNIPIKESDLPEDIKPFLELTQKLGFLASKISNDHIEAIKIILEGKIGQYTESFTNFATIGALSTQVGENINYDNASAVANERGISLSNRIEPPHSGLTNKVTVQITANNEVVSISGTVFDNDLLRILDINGFDVDVAPKGKMILFKNSDVPGVIGEVGTLLGKHGINIADFRLGRKNKEEGKALAVIIVDNDVPNQTIEELKNLKACIKVSYVTI